MKKTKKMIAPNECSLGRWIAALTVGFVLGSLLATPLQMPLLLRPELVRMEFMGIALETLSVLLSFVVYFWSMVLAVKWIAKTSLRDFVLGVGGRINKKECLTLFGLQAAGIAISSLLCVQNIYLRGVSAGTFAVLVILMLPLSLMQTAWEELIFRGIFLRWACGNKIGFTKKALLAGVFSSVLFGLVHISNPEISSMTGTELLVGLICYIVPGIMFFLADLHFGSLLPGIILHWANNFLLFTLISAEVTAMPMPTLLVDGTEQTAFWMLLSTAIAYVPALAYILWQRRTRAGTAEEA